MGEDHRGLTTGTGRHLEPSWPTVISNTVRLWLERRKVVRRRPLKRRQRFVVLVVSALLAMGVGAGVTSVLTQQEQPSAAPRPSNAAQSTTPTPVQVAAANRQQAAAWIASQVGSNRIVACDPEMCTELEKTSFPAAALLELPPTAPDPLGSDLVVATPVIRNQFGPRLASVYAPLVIASFGSGPERVDVRFVPPGGAAAFEAHLATDRNNRIAAGEQLLKNKNVHASAAARAALLAGQVDPRLLVTLGALAGEMPLELVAFDDSSPGASAAVPLRGAEIGAAASAGLPAMLAFLKAQRTPFLPAEAHLAPGASGQSVVTVRFDAPGPMGLGGS
jgi:hypothetical protein